MGTSQVVPGCSVQRVHLSVARPEAECRPGGPCALETEDVLAGYLKLTWVQVGGAGALFTEDSFTGQLRLK